MSLLTSRRGHQYQPQYPTRVDTEGLGKGVRFLFNPAVGPTDLVTGQYWTPAGNVYTKEDRVGRVFSFDGSGDYFANVGNYGDLTGHGTFFAFLPVVGPPSAFGHIYLGSNSPSTMAFQVDGSGNVWMGSDSQATISAASWFNSTHRSLVCVSGPSAAQVKVFIDGQTAAATGVTTGAQWNAGAKTMRLGGYPTGSNWDFSGEMLIVGWADRLWTLEDAKLFHELPFAVLARVKMFFVPADLSGGTTHNLTVVGAVQGATKGSFVVQQDHQITGVQGEAQGATAGTFAVQQNHQVTVNGLTQDALAGTFIVTTGAVLVFPGATQGATASTFAVQQSHSVSPSGLAQGAVAGTFQVSQTHMLTASGLTQGAAAGTFALPAPGEYVFPGSVQAALAGTFIVQQTYTLAVDGAIQSIVAGTFLLEQMYLGWTPDGAETDSWAKDSSITNTWS